VFAFFDEVVSGFITKLFWLAMLVSTVGAFWSSASVLGYGYKAAQLRTVQSYLSPKIVNSRADTQPGEIVLVEGNLSVSGLSLPPDEPVFQNVAGVEKEVEQGTSEDKWKFEKQIIWLPNEAKVADFQLDLTMLKEPQLESIPVAPGVDYRVPVWPQYDGVTVSGSTIEYIDGQVRKRAIYRVWPSEVSVLVLGQVDGTGTKLNPFDLGSLRKKFWMMRPSGDPVGSFIANEISRDVLMGLRWIMLFALAGILFWCSMLVRERTNSKQAIWLRATWPSVVCAVPMTAYTIWPATSADYTISLLVCLVLFVVAFLVSAVLTWKSR
jgi:hypothetical protein